MRLVTRLPSLQIHALSLVAFVALSGCAGVAPTSLTSVENSSIELKEPFIFVAEFFTGIRHSHVISSGKYQSVGKDAAGIYYKGPVKCLSSTVVPNGAALPDQADRPQFTADCGIYIPTDVTQPARVFVVVGSEMAAASGTPEGSSAASTGVSIVTSQVVANSNATPLQGGVGGGIGAAIVGAAIEAEKGRFSFVRNQKLGPELRQAVQLQL